MADTYTLTITHQEANVLMRAVAAYNDQLAHGGAPKRKGKEQVALDAQVGTWVVQRILRLISERAVNRLKQEGL
jgi:hypothetical protein